MAALEPGDPRAVGDYQVLSRLGTGGMGRVFLGRSPGGRLVAVKVVHAELLRRPEFRPRFRREVAAARMVSGAFTAPVVDADPDADLPWLVTSYIAGPSLEQAVDEQGPFASATVLALAAGLAEALRSIHATSLVHRDLKPSNVLLAEDGPRVIDFGIARTIEADSLTRTGHLTGSPGFMSPEQVAGAEITPASDVFSLGTVLCFAATGRNPFGAGPAPALLYRVVHNEPDTEAIDDPALRSLISACLAKDPALRPTPRDILATVGRPDATAGHWPTAADPTHAHAHAHAGTPVDPRVASYPPVASHSRTAAGSDSTTVRNPAAPHPHEAHPDHPNHPSTQVDTAPTPAPTPPATPTGPSASAPAPGRRGRRAFLVSGAVTVAALGTGAGFWLSRSERGDQVDGKGADGKQATGSASASATVRRAEAVAVWPLDEASGTVARDTVGGDDGTATNVLWRAGQDGAAEFDGKTSQIVTAGEVLRTGPGRSFTVAAWVCLSTEPEFFATAVSQEVPGDSGGSGFFLQYAKAENRWAFARPGLRAVGYTVPAPGTWTHLAGVCDGATRKLRLYVNGVLEVEVDDTNPTAATGPLVIGRAKYAGQPSGFFVGAIKDVRVFGQALTAARIKTLKTLQQ